MKTKFDYKELSQISRKYHAKNGYIGYIVFFFASLFAAGILLLNLLLPFLFVIIVPFVVIPFIFAAQVALDVINIDGYLSFKGFIRCFTVYFSEHFRSTYRVLRSAVVFLAVYIAFLLTSIFVVSLAFYYTNYLNTGGLVYELMHADIYDMEVLDSILVEYDYLVQRILICTNLPSLAAASLTFAYLCSKNSYTLPYRLRDFKYPGRYFANVGDLVIKKNRKLFLQCYWSLNWPLAVLFILGLGLGGYIGYIYSYTAGSIYTFGIVIAIFISFVIFGSKYFANKQAIAEYLLPEYKVEEYNIQSQFADVLKSMINNMKEDSEDTKKDSNES